MPVAGAKKSTETMAGDNIRKNSPTGNKKGHQSTNKLHTKTKCIQSQTLSSNRKANQNYWAILQRGSNQRNDKRRDTKDKQVDSNIPQRKAKLRQVEINNRFKDIQQLPWNTKTPSTNLESIAGNIARQNFAVGHDHGSERVLSQPATSFNYTEVDEVLVQQQRVSNSSNALWVESVPFLVSQVCPSNKEGLASDGHQTQLVDRRYTNT